MSTPDARSAPELSVVVPVYRNRTTLRELVERLDRALSSEDREYVFVVDGSPDDSLTVLLELQADRPWLRVLELARNFGQHAALCCGFEAARGACVLVLDADLQQRPEDLPRFVEAWRGGSDFVSGWRTRRADPLARRLGSRLLNALVRRVTGVRLHDWGCPLAAIDRSVFERVAPSGEQRRFLKPLVAKLSRRPTEVQIEGHEREGRSSYSGLALVGLTLDFVVAFSARPFLKLIGIGAAGVALGALAGVLYVLLRLAGVLDEEPRIQAAVVLAVMLGIQVVVLGALGEYTHRIYRMVQGAPFFDLREEHVAASTAEPAPVGVSAGEEEGRPDGAG